MMKKIWTLLLAVCMVTVMMPAMAFADVPSAGTLTFTCQSNAVTGGSIFYKLGTSDTFVKVSEDSKNNTYESVSLNDATSITIKLITNKGYSLDTTRGVAFRANGADVFNITGANTAAFTSETGYTINLSELTGSEGSISQSSFELEFGFGGSGGSAVTPPSSNKGELAINCASNAVTGGSIYYKLNTSGEFVNVTENSNDNKYASVSLNDATSITIKLVANEGYSLDDTRGVVLRVNGAEKFKKKGADIVDFTSDTGHTFNLSDLVGNESSISQSSFELEFGFGGSGGSAVTPPSSNKGELAINCASNAVTGGSIYYKLNTSGEFVKVTEDSNDNKYASVSLNDATSITIKFVANEDYSLDATRGVVLRVNGAEKFNKTGGNIVDFTSDTGHTFNLSDLVGSESSISQSSFELEFGFGQDSNTGSEGDKRPTHYGENGYISFDTNGTDGSISYACGDDVRKLQGSDWKAVSVDGNYYSPVNMNDLGNGSTVFFRIEGKNSKHLDLDRFFTVTNGERKPLYTVYGSFNNDPEYDTANNGAQPSNKTGLKDMYDNMNDCYIIPVSKSYLVSDSTTNSIDARFIECSWTDITSIKVSVDDASQYMIANGKTEIGIATGKGFSVSVQDGCKVSVPALQDIDLGGNEERYLIDLKVNRSYFIPYISINGNSYETFDTGTGGKNFTNIAVAVPAEEFKDLITNNNGTLTIHLTVDKSVPVGSAEGQGTVDMQASFNMIDNGTIPESTTIQDLDASVELTAQEAALSDEDRGEGAVEAYEITMDIANKNETVFIVPINISIDGNFDGDENGYSVIREHEGEIPQDIPCTIEKGENSSTLSFSTNKFSKFTIMYGSSSSGGSSGGNSGGGSIPAPSEPADNTITNSGSGSDASTSVDVSDQTTVTDSKAEITIDADLGSKIVENAINNKSSEVVINAGTSAGDSSESTVALPASTVKALAGEEVQASVTIKTDNATVQFDKDAVSAVAEQTGAYADVKLVVQTKEPNKNKVEIELTLETSDGTKISDFKGGSVTVTVPVSEELASKKIVCVYIDNNGKYTKMEGSLSVDGKSYTFTTGHFSTYAILEKAEADAVISKQNIKVGTANVKLYTAKGGKLRVKASAKNATGYKVYYKKSTWNNYKTYTKGKVKTLDKTFKKLSKGKYTVKVKAYNKDYDGTGSVIWGKLSGAKKITVRR